MIGPFIDTIIICLMTALVCMITGAYQLAEFQGTGWIYCRGQNDGCGI